ncbi:MAG TPA: type II toxin-antitoxin system VapC family toxin [Thermoanaerobaculia bacterium]|nr:type II toxin-antitoxin system VapC family toxin [Thermoanaerobaculia bacterium]
MPREFALDSTIVVILAGGHSGEPRAKERAESILLEHEDAGEIVGVPAAAWAECCHVDLDVPFVIWPLNAKAAVIANRLTPPMIEAGKAKGLTRREVKIDALILATAEAEGCAALYTTDGWFGTAARDAGLRIQVRPLPPVRPMQATIPEIP